MDSQHTNEQNKDIEDYIPIDPFGILRHTVLTDIFDNIMKFQPDFVMIACDHKKTWRKKYFEGYKGQRKEARDKDKFDYEEFFIFLSQFIEELKSTMPFLTVQIPNLEGDDIIAQMVKKNHHDNEIIFITADQDFYQLMQYDNVKMYNPLKKEMIEKSRSEALNDLEVKIIMGDKSDNIPACRPKIGEKTAIKLILGDPISKKEGKTLSDLMEEKDFKKNYDRNKRLIDLNNCPKALVKKLNEYVNNYQYSGISKIFDYFVKNRLKELMGKSSIIGKDLKRLVEYNERIDHDTLFAR